MDSSAAGKPPGMPPAEGWGRQVPVAGPTVVARAQSVRPPKDSREARDKRKERPRDDRDADGGSEREDDRPAPQPTPHLRLQAVDPETGRVYWQAPLPSQALPDPVGPDPVGPDPVGYLPPKPASPPMTPDPATVDTENPNSAGLLGKRAYEHHDDDESRPHVVRTA